MHRGSVTCPVSQLEMHLPFYIKVCATSCCSFPLTKCTMILFTCVNSTLLPLWTTTSGGQERVLEHRTCQVNMLRESCFEAGVCVTILIPWQLCRSTQKKHTRELAQDSTVVWWVFVLAPELRSKLEVAC